MRCFLLDLLPQMLDRIEVWRIGREWLDGQAIRMRVEKLLHRLAGVVASTILDHHHMVLGLRQAIAQKGGRAFRVEAACMSFGEKAPREIVDESKDLVALALATGGHCGLLAFGRPGVR